jgi:cytochrome c biogenesis protein CcmG, thiol:disulfide interchange protein DsbE
VKRTAALAMLLVACAGQRPVVRASWLVGQTIELAALDLQGQVVDVAADQGRVRVVDFWASWCEPCREEMVALDALLRERGQRNLEVYGVSFDEGLEQVKEFLRKTPVGFPILWDKGGVEYTERYQVERLPTTLLVDRQGVIRFVHQAYGRSTREEIRHEVDRLLAEPR